MADDANTADFPAAVLSRLLDITDQRFHQLVRMGIIPKTARGKYPLAGAVRGYIKYLRKTGASSEIPPDQLEPFQRKAHYQAQLGKLNLQREAGELVPALEMEAEMASAFKALSRFLDTLPDVLERECGMKPAQISLIEKTLDRTRDELYVQLVNRDGSDGKPDAASA